MSDSEDATTIPTGVEFETPLAELDKMPELPPGHALVAIILIIIPHAHRAFETRRKIVTYEQIKSLQKMLGHKEVLRIDLTLIPAIPRPPAVPALEETEKKSEDDN